MAYSYNFIPAEQLAADHPHYTTDYQDPVTKLRDLYAVMRGDYIAALREADPQVVTKALLAYSPKVQGLDATANNDDAFKSVNAVHAVLENDVFDPKTPASYPVRAAALDGFIGVMEAALGVFSRFNPANTDQIGHRMARFYDLVQPAHYAIATRLEEMQAEAVPHGQESAAERLVAASEKFWAALPYPHRGREGVELMPVQYRSGASRPVGQGRGGASPPPAGTGLT